MSYANSPKQSSSSQGSASEEYIKIVEQLIDSDDDQMVMKKLAELQAVFPVLKKLTAALSNQEKISLFLRDHVFRFKLTQKLRDSNRLFYDPIVKVELYTVRHRCSISEELNQHDLERTFEKFGSLEILLFDKTSAYLRYDSYVSCFLVIKTLNQFEVNDTLRLAVSWCDDIDINKIQQHYAARCLNDFKGIKKSMARYDIYLQANSEFELSKRIIGPKGTNMKKILAEVLQKNKILGPFDNSVAKLRLRGKGSGFFQGPNHQESDQMLNLCLSGKDSAVLNSLCEQCEKLLLKISTDYKEHYFKLHKKQCEGIVYRKYELKKNSYEMTKQFNLEQINTTLDFIDPAQCKRKRLKEKEIFRLITLRDKARRQGKFMEADQIREHLQSEGVLLVDQKHAGGKELKTTWKFM